MLQNRIIPLLLLRRRALVKSIKFKDPSYVGDPINTVRTFNEREVDEVVIVDITASPEKHEPQYELLEEIAAEAFMPFAYGGGIQSVSRAREIFLRGAEKVIVNTASLARPELITELAETFGSQSVVVSIDCKCKWRGGWAVYTNNAREKTRWAPEEWAMEAAALGAGEIMLSSIDQEGTFEGYDLELTKKVVQSVDIPVIAVGGAGDLKHMREAVKEAGASAAAAGSLFVFQGSHRAVLVNYPERKQLDDLLC